MNEIKNELDNFAARKDRDSLLYAGISQIIHSLINGHIPEDEGWMK